MKILYLEDDADFGENLSALLKEEGYEVIWSKTPREAAFKIKEGVYYDILVTDLRFGGEKQDIVDVFRISREMMPKAPIVVLSGYSFRRYKMYFGEIEPDECLTKSGDLEVFLNLIEQLLKGGRDED